MDSFLKSRLTSASYSVPDLWQNKDSTNRVVLHDGIPSSTYSRTKVRKVKSKQLRSTSASTRIDRTLSEDPDTNSLQERPHFRSRGENPSRNLVSSADSSSAGVFLPGKSLEPRVSEEEVRWVRPLGYTERFMTIASQRGNMTTVYAMFMESEVPVTFDLIKSASQLMFRKMPHLRLCIGNYKNDRWWREMDIERLDIYEIRTSDVIGTFESLLKRRYNLEEGPLWFVRFITSPSGDGLFRDNLNTKGTHVCIFGFHHNVSDGMTNMSFCNIFLKLLNDLILGREVELKEEGRFAYPIHDRLSDEVRSYPFYVQLVLNRVYKGLIRYCKFVSNFIQHYPMPVDHEGSTNVIYSELNEATTQRLLKRCKMEGVTLNTAFTAAANIGMYKMILQKDISLDSTCFNNQHIINMRRYWPKEERENSYGCHMSMLDSQIPTKKDDIYNFWEYARRIHLILYDDLITKERPLKMQAMSERLWIAVFANSWITKNHLPSSSDSHYCITNMGDISSIFSGEGEVVSVSRVLRSVSSHFILNLCQHTLQTFRGKFHYSLDFYTQKMSMDTARAYASCLLDTLIKVIHLPN